MGALVTPDWRRRARARARARRCAALGGGRARTLGEERAATAARLAQRHQDVRAAALHHQRAAGKHPRVDRITAALATASCRPRTIRSWQYRALEVLRAPHRRRRGALSARGAQARIADARRQMAVSRLLSTMLGVLGLSQVRRRRRCRCSTICSPKDWLVHAREPLSAQVSGELVLERGFSAR